MSLNNFRAGGSILTKLLQTTCRQAWGDNARTTFGRPALKNLGGPKNVQIWARFLTTFDFDREYFWNGSTYRTSGKKT